MLGLKYVHILNSHYRHCDVDKQTIPSSRYSSLFPGLDDKKSAIEIIAGGASAHINVHFCLFYFKRFVERQIFLPLVLLHLTSRSILGDIAPIVELTIPS